MILFEYRPGHFVNLDQVATVYMDSITVTHHDDDYDHDVAAGTHNDQTKFVGAFTMSEGGHCGDPDSEEGSICTRQELEHVVWAMRRAARGEKGACDYDMWSKATEDDWRS